MNDWHTVALSGCVVVLAALIVGLIRRITALERRIGKNAG